MKNLFILDAILQVSNDAVQTLHDALAAQSTAGWIVAGVAAVVIILPLVLKALGKSVPLLDTLLDVVLSVAKSFVKPKDPVDVNGTPEQKAAEAAQPGVKAVGDVVDINSLKKPDGK